MARPVLASLLVVVLLAAVTTGALAGRELQQVRNAARCHRQTKLHSCGRVREAGSGSPGAPGSRQNWTRCQEKRRQLTRAAGAAACTMLLLRCCSTAALPLLAATQQKKYNSDDARQLGTPQKNQCALLCQEAAKAEPRYNTPPIIAFCNSECGKCVTAVAATKQGACVCWLAGWQAAWQCVGARGLTVPPALASAVCRHQGAPAGPVPDGIQVSSHLQGHRPVPGLKQ